MINLSVIRILTIISLLSLVSCAQENLKPSDENQSDISTNESVSKADREKYRDGITALYNNDLANAQRIFNEFIRNKPQLAGAYTNLALIHFKKKEHDKSHKLVNKAL